MLLRSVLWIVVAMSLIEPTSVASTVSMYQEHVVNESLQRQYDAMQEWYFTQASRFHVVQFSDQEAPIHPLVWCGLKLTLLAGAMAWASSEWEWEMLMRSIKRKFRLLAPGIGNKAG